MLLDAIETGSFSSEDLAPQPKDHIRVVSWNVARGSRLAEIIEFLRSSKADLICLQETDCNARRTEGRNIAAEIASALQMNYAFGIEFQELSQGSSGSPAYHGQATLSTFPVSDSRILRFRNQSRFWHPYWWVPKVPKLQRRLGGRMALLTNVNIGERNLAVYNLHLESRSDSMRRAQLSELLQDTRQYDRNTPTVLAGDFNFDLNGAAASAVADMRFHNPFEHQHQRTTPSNHIGRKGAIDWILIKGQLCSVAALVHSSVSASDHYPLSLTLRLS
jgi:endonuclease/exonuclease/phosphatase family metal-dependent hydrolase